MIRYRKIIELHEEGISLRGIAANTGSFQSKSNGDYKSCEKERFGLYV